MATGTGTIKLTLILALVAFLVSCRQNITFTGQVNFGPEGWSKNAPARFTTEITDTTSASSVKIILRTGSDYPFRNIYLFVTTHAPGGFTMTDTLEYMIADAKGNRYGKGTGDIRELRLNYRTNVFFPASGLFVFEIEQAMRTEPLKGVYDIGLRIERESGNKR
ncbi:MAG: gliding motility lipoprotein GldH [Bacteroidales bacterium]|jgi:gliding motility-associated lipoprotein GldH|nr:gliding motility lipoprotein GldH [Bacteroidales bacterium]